MKNKKYIFAIIASIMMLSASCSFFSKPPAGILKTANGGVDWQASNKLKGNEKANISSLSVSKLDFDPQGSDIVYASAFNSGLFVSKDGGGSWEELLGSISVNDFAINPADNKTIYVAGSFDAHARALVTRDGGKSWNEIFSDGVKNTTARAVAINPLNPQQILLGHGKAELILSVDGGVNWRLVQTFKSQVNKIIWRREGLYVATKAGIFKSIDNAYSFQQITLDLKLPANSGSSSSYGSKVASFNQLTVSKNSWELLYITTNLGVFRSGNGGASWEFITLPLRQRELVPGPIAISNSDSVVYVGAGNNIYKTSDGGVSWLTADTGTKSVINALLVSPELAQVAYAGLFRK